MDSSKKQHIGLRIKERREELGMTQEELSKKLGYKSRSTINKIEMGINDIPQSKIERFAQALEVPPIVLMGWDYPIPKKNDPDYLPNFNNTRLRQGPPEIVKNMLRELEEQTKTMEDKDIEELVNYAKYIKSKKKKDE